MLRRIGSGAAIRPQIPGSQGAFQSIALAFETPQARHVYAAREIALRGGYGLFQRRDAALNFKRIRPLGFVGCEGDMGL